MRLMAWRRARIYLMGGSQATHRGAGRGACCGAKQRISADRAQNGTAGSTDASASQRPTTRRFAAGCERK